MAVIKNKKSNTWEVRTYYKDYTGKRHQKTKRGFKRKSDAQTWEYHFKLKERGSVDMAFSDFIDIYMNDIKPRIKLNTWVTKQYIIDTKIRPYFKDKGLSDITPADIIAWQNEISRQINKKGERYSPVYLKTIHSQMSAILNHGVNVYNLDTNVAKKVGNMGKDKYKEMSFWTLEEFNSFIHCMEKNPIAYNAFLILYWCGLREGELLALTSDDFLWDTNTLIVDKSYQRIRGKDVITDPKTKKSIRRIKIPDFLSAEIREYIISEGYKTGDRIFPVNKCYLNREMNKGIDISGVKKIRVHDLRHSHVSLLIDMGFSALAIAERVGHEAVDITYRYAHLFPTVQDDMAKLLEEKHMTN